MIYEELSLKELSEKIGKSKSTISRNITPLIDNELVEISRSEPVRGSIEANFYKLSENFFKIRSINTELMATINQEEQKILQAQTTINILQNGIKFSDQIHQYVKDYLKKYENMDNRFLYLKQFFDSFYQGNYIDAPPPAFYLTSWFSESEISQILIAFDDFKRKIAEIVEKTKKTKDQTNDSFSGRPYYFFAEFINAKKILEEKPRSAPEK